MPHKRNPILSERICGMARVVRANSYRRSGKRCAVARTRHLAFIRRTSGVAGFEHRLDYMLHKMTSLIDGLVVYPERMLRESCMRRADLIFSGQLLLALTQNGVSREKAYEWVQRNAMKVWDEDEDFHALVAADKEIRAHLSE